jgi:hypothetical protein
MVAPARLLKRTHNIIHAEEVMIREAAKTMVTAEARFSPMFDPVIPRVRHEVVHDMLRLGK